MTFVTTGPLDSVLALQQVTGVFDLNVHTQTLQAEHTAVVQNHAFGIASTPENFKGEVVVARDPDTGAGDFGACGASTSDCCCPLTNAAAVAGKIAMCDRGTCGFGVKALIVQRAGAAGYLLANNSAAAPPVMGGASPAEPITIPCTSTTQAAGTAFKAYVVGASGPIRVSIDDRRLMACDDDGNPIPGNDYASIISGCLPAGKYMLSVRGFSTSNGPYVFQMKGVAGCVPTVPPTLNAPFPGTSFCPPAASYERSCAYPFLP
jgi:hypothetical protein